MRIFLTAVAAICIVASTAGDLGFSQARQTAPSIEGVWLGVSVESTGANASKNPKRLPALQIFTKGHYSAVAQDVDVPRPPRQAPPPPKTPGKLTDAEKVALYEFWAPVVAQAGMYEIKGNTVILRQMVAKGMPIVQTLEFRLEDGGKTFVLITKTVPGQPVREVVRRYTRLE